MYIINATFLYTLFGSWILDKNVEVDMISDR